MSRGSKVFYITSNSALPSISTIDGTETLAQELDVAVVKDPSLSINEMEIYQCRRATGASLSLAWKKMSADDIADRLVFTDDTIIPNVTKNRKAHVEEVRNFINFLYSTSASRFGSLYYHTHNFTKAKQVWDNGATSKARMEFRTVGNDNWLTLFFGSKSTVDQQAASDKFKIAYLDAVGAQKDIADFLGWSVFFWVDTRVQENLYVSKNAFVSLNLTVTKDLDISGTSLFRKLVTMNEGLNVTGNVTLNDAIQVAKDSSFLARLTAKYLTVQTDATFDFDLHVGNTIYAEFANIKDTLTSETINATKIVVDTDTIIGKSTTIGKDLTVTEKLHVLGDATVDAVLRAPEIRLTSPGTPSSSAVLKYNTYQLLLVEESGASKNITLGGTAYASLNVDASGFTWKGNTVVTEAKYGHLKGINADTVDDIHGKDLVAATAAVDARVNTHELKTVSTTQAVHGIKPGADGGFDADLLDGKQGSYYESLASDATNHVYKDLQQPLLGNTSPGDLRVHGKLEGHQDINLGWGINADRLDNYHLQDILNKIPSKIIVCTVEMDTGAAPLAQAGTSHYHGSYASRPLWINMGTPEDLTVGTYPYFEMNLDSVIASNNIQDPVIVPILTQSYATAYIISIGSPTFEINGARMDRSGNTIRVTLYKGTVHGYGLGGYFLLGSSRWSLTCLVASSTMFKQQQSTNLLRPWNSVTFM